MATEAAPPLFKLHIEPEAPLEIKELTNALGSISRQFQDFVEKNPSLGRGAKAKLLVDSVARGSIDINLLPDYPNVLGLLSGAYEPIKFVTKFAGHVKELIKLFSDGKEKAVGHEVSISQCQDVINTAAPIANHGGTQTVNIVNNTINLPPIISMNHSEAISVMKAGQETLEALTGPLPPSKKQRVALEWTRIDRLETKQTGLASPDKAKIAEIDSVPHPVFFVDETLSLKNDMLDGDDNPYGKVYFVDIEISYASNGKVVSYRVTGYHGKDNLG